MIRQCQHAECIYAACETSGQKPRRQLASDNPVWDNIPFPTNAESIGEVRWRAKTLA